MHFRMHIRFYPDFLLIIGAVIFAHLKKNKSHCKSWLSIVSPPVIKLTIRAFKLKPTATVLLEDTETGEVTEFLLAIASKEPLITYAVLFLVGELVSFFKFHIVFLLFIYMLYHSSIIGAVIFVFYIVAYIKTASNCNSCLLLFHLLNIFSRSSWMLSHTISCMSTNMLLGINRMILPAHPTFGNTPHKSTPSKRY